MASITQNFDTVFDMDKVNPTPGSVLQSSGSRYSYVSQNDYLITLVGTGLTYDADGGLAGGTLTRVELTPPSTSANGAFVVDTGLNVTDLPGDFLSNGDAFWSSLLSGNDTFDLSGASDQRINYEDSGVAGDGTSLSGSADFAGGNDTMILSDAVGWFYGDLVNSYLGSTSPGDQWTFAGGDDTITGGAGADYQTIFGDAENVFYSDFVGGDDAISAFSTGRIYGDVDDYEYGGSFTGGDDLITIDTDEGYTVYGDASGLGDLIRAVTFKGGADRILAGDSTAGLTIYGDLSSLNFSKTNGTGGTQAILGNDEIVGGSGSDAIYGDVDYVSTRVTTRFGNDEITGNAGNDIIYGDYEDISSSTSSFLLSGGHDTIDGGAGNDRIYGALGNDVLNGGDGDDFIQAGRGNDVVDGGAGTDTLSFAAADLGADVYLSAGFSRGGTEGRDSLVSIENVDGSNFDDRLIGDSGANILKGGDGDDVMKAKGGDDLIYGGDGDDRVVGGSGDEKQYGNSGSDRLSGLAGDDLLDGGSGDDFLYGGRDNDIVGGGDGNDVVRGNLGNDQLFGDYGDDNLYGGGSNDTMFGGYGTDYLFGENGADRIDGGRGDDVLTGGLAGGDGDGVSDTFVFGYSIGFDRVKDFEVGIDKIEFGGNYYFRSFAELEPFIASAGAGGANTKIDFGRGDVIYLFDVEADSLTADDFIL